MNKTQLIAAVAEKSGLQKKDAEKAVASFIDVIIDAVKNDEKVQIIGFGTFEQRKRAERAGINLQTKEPIVVKACKVPAFKPGKSFKETVNQ